MLTARGSHIAETLSVSSPYKIPSGEERCVKIKLPIKSLLQGDLLTHASFLPLY